MLCSATTWNIFYLERFKNTNDSECGFFFKLQTQVKGCRSVRTISHWPILIIIKNLYYFTNKNMVYLHTILFCYTRNVEYIYTVLAPNNFIAR